MHTIKNPEITKDVKITVTSSVKGEKIREDHMKIMENDVY